jgi:hypothetical protein
MDKNTGRQATVLILLGREKKQGQGSANSTITTPQTLDPYTSVAALPVQGIDLFYIAQLESFNLRLLRNGLEIPLYLRDPHSVVRKDSSIPALSVGIPVLAQVLYSST